MSSAGSVEREAIIMDDGHSRSLYKYKQGSRVHLPMAIFAFLILSSSL